MLVFVNTLVSTINLSYGQNKPQIVLSSRLFHPVDAKDTLNTLDIIDQFQPSKIDWMYCTNAKQLDELKKRGIAFSLAIHPELADSAGKTSTKFRIVDVDGQPIITPWLRGAKVYWGCVNNPGWQQLYLSFAKNLIDLGAYAIFEDDPLFNIQPGMDGCFCDYCMKGFTKYLMEKGVNVTGDFCYKTEMLKDAASAKARYEKLFKDYQQQSVILFYKNWMGTLRSYKKGIKFLLNNYRGNWTDHYEIYKAFDGGICEVEDKDINYQVIDNALKAAKQLGKTQAFNFESDNENVLYGAILYAYANGAEALLPWDAWIQAKSTRAQAFRFYGKKENYTDLLFLLKNVILNADFTKSVDNSILSKYRLSAGNFLCYRYTNGTEAYNIIFNLDTKNNSQTFVDSRKIKKMGINNRMYAHYSEVNNSLGLRKQKISSKFFVIKE